MAYMNQEKKKIISQKLKEVMPKGWKYSVGVRNHSTIVLTISEANVNLLEGISSTYLDVNQYSIERTFKDDVLYHLTKIFEVLNTGNYDNSDAQTDYFDKGHYVDLNIGKYDKPFKFVA